MKGHGVWFRFACVRRDDDGEVFRTGSFVRGACIARPPPTFTPAFLNSTVAASFAARAIAGSLRTRSCAIEPSTSKASCVASASASRDAELHQQVAKPEAAAFLEGDGDLSDRPVFAEFGNRIDERAAAKILRRKAPLQRIEGAENLLDRRFVRWTRRHEAPRQIGRDQRVLGREMIVERALADADFGRDGVDADRANSLQIEQPIRGFENPVLHVGFGGQGCHANARVMLA